MYDCIVCGTCCVDLLMTPMRLDEPIGYGETLHLNELRAMTGGLVCNVGGAMGRLGLKVAALTLVGQDHWASILLDDLQSNEVDTSHIATSADVSSSTTAVMIGENGEHSFAHNPGALGLMDAELFYANLDLFSKCRIAHVGYYALNSDFDEQLPDIARAIREQGCKVSLDVAGGGGTMKPLDRILPHLDFYVPSRAEAIQQTGQTDPAEMIRVFRDHDATGLLGVKLGEEGALLSPSPDCGNVVIEPVSPPGSVVDTTGAGDCFCAGLLAGIVNGLSIEDAGRLGAAAGACCVTDYAGTAGVRDFTETRSLAGV